MTESYKQAIELIAEMDPERLKQAAITIAQEVPDVFVEVCKNKAWIGKARMEMLCGNKVGAIKICREVTGWGLKEAKDAVELEMRKLGVIQ